MSIMWRFEGNSFKGFPRKLKSQSIPEEYGQMIHIDLTRTIRKSKKKNIYGEKSTMVKNKILFRIKKK